jgi:hypothetical protein
MTGQTGVFLAQRRPPADDHEIAVRVGKPRHNLFGCGAQTAAHPIADNGVTNPARNRKANPDGRRIFGVTFIVRARLKD